MEHLPTSIHATCQQAFQALHLGPYDVRPAHPSLPVLTLAPMDGVTHWVFRLLCARLGARIVGSEFVNCRNIDAAALHVQRTLDFSDLQVYRATGLALLSTQIYGNDPALIAAGARRLAELGSPVIDINFGCAVPRVVSKGAGAAFLRDLDRLESAIRLTVQAVDVPVTIKTRLGWDEGSISILEIVRRAEDAGARAVTVHARTARQRYSGAADWMWIGRACQAASLPIIGNGDVRTPEDARRLQRLTGCAAVMIGRAAMANPWIFAGRCQVPFTERIDLAVTQLQHMARFKGERTGVLETRKHLALYFHDLPRQAPIRRRILTTESLPELIGALRAWQEELVNGAPTG